MFGIFLGNSTFVTPKKTLSLATVDYFSAYFRLFPLVYAYFKRPPPPGCGGGQGVELFTGI